ncbi:pyridoxamine 5'-phosphate oxidase family protein [Streptomyces sp. NPDC048434]|uniref:pyridoxamine 5'-phosphate oxidase family protein n=1 Tax=Streptomyces sp. NPDC048434 TaxID=3365549 RepID=UPI00371A807E
MVAQTALELGAGGVQAQQGFVECAARRIHAGRLGRRGGTRNGLTAYTGGRKAAGGGGWGPFSAGAFGPGPYPDAGQSMMVGSRKALDLRRDPRFSLHANPGPGTDLSGGDVRVSGRAVEVTDPDVVARYAAEVKPPEPFHLFRAELTEAVRTHVEDSYVVLESWVPGRPLRTIRRTSGDAAAQVDSEAE